MGRNSIWIAVIVGLAAFAGGFGFANYLNRTEMTNLRGENERLRSGQADVARTAEGVNLSEEEISAKLAEAEQNASNFGFQKNLGLGLYRYGAIKQDRAIIERSIPVLERAAALDPKDVDVLIGLGHAHYDVGYFGKDNASFERARGFYNKVLALRPDDIEVRTDLGLTYYLQDPPDHAKAVAELERSLAIDPKHEKTLQFLILTKRGQNADASKHIETLRAINPNNPVLRELASPTADPAPNTP